MHKRKWLFVAMATALAGLGGCEWEFGTIGSDKEGSLTLKLADAPVDDLTAVVITVKGVELKPSDGDSFTVDFDNPQPINLLDLQNGDVETLLNDESVPADSYEWVRLILSQQSSDQYATGDNGGTYGLVIPSGDQSGLKVNAGFSVADNKSVSMTLDFDVRKSVVAPTLNPSTYFLKPVLRLVDDDNVGSISGTVDESTILQTHCTSVGDFAGLVYVYEGADVEPDDLGGATEPVAAVPVTDRINPGTFRYKASLLNEGDYTVSYSCGKDDVEANESLSFLDPVNVEVEAGDDTDLDLE
ncbi:DUF4382 domain-containing protein [Marinobacter halodurans]|uniref:DUF4382 domain-containing protein n=1 Tax=Marinobacter halodurans TaxID=2528979 RepID=A0ABY1ZFK4_9GAMM|nr:DUF4382 domain-containing protein [Marinobacter halodurans]TBW49670.1 DUF4382 domain-containing protein [Marinobacter halodurans]